MNQSEVIRLHTKENGTLDYDTTVPCIIFSPIGFVTDEEFKNFLNLGLQFMVEKKKVHGKMAWLADTSRLGALLSEEWAAKDWNPRALAEGIYHVAFVLPRDVFGQMPVENYLEMNKENQSSAKMSTAMFEDLESAKGWLRDSLSKS
jgi:hypothetical protein